MILLLRVRQDYTSRADEASIIGTKISMTGPFDCSLAYRILPTRLGQTRR